MGGRDWAQLRTQGLRIKEAQFKPEVHDLILKQNAIKALKLGAGIKGDAGHVLAVDGGYLAR